jgi:hypothetical protein
MAFLEIAHDSRTNPLQVVEEVAVVRDWSFERSGEDEVSIVVKGEHTDYQVSFTWMAEIEALHLACTFDLKIPEARQMEAQRLVALINEQLWIGHFDLWLEPGLVMFRQALILAGGALATSEQCEAMLAAATDSCERYFAAFQYAVWAGKTAREALDAVMFETQGEA